MLHLLTIIVTGVTVWLHATAISEDIVFLKLQMCRSHHQTFMHCHNWWTPFEVLKRDKPNMSYLRVMGCRAYIFILEEVCVNKLAPRAELMTFLGYTNGTKGFCFMQSPNNIIFQATTALFDECMFPHCPDTMDQSHTCVDKYNLPEEIILLEDSDGPLGSTQCTSGRTELSPTPI